MRFSRPFDNGNSSASSPDRSTALLIGLVRAERRTELSIVRLMGGIVLSEVVRQEDKSEGFKRLHCLETAGFYSPCHMFLVTMEATQVNNV